MKKNLTGLVSLFLMFSSLTTNAATSLANNPPSPVGAWQTIDDVSHTPRSVILITLNDNQQLIGKLIKINYRPGEGPNDVCVKCKGELHNQKIIGLTILSGMVQNPANPLEWRGGKIVDPESGKVYDAKLFLSPDGHSMKVHGYIVFSFLGRTQIWNRL